MAFETPTVEELRERALLGLNAELPEVRTGAGTLARLETGTYAQVVRDNHVRLDELDANTTPDTATDAGVERWAATLSIPRKEATGARKANALQIQGTVGATVPADTELTYQGLRYKVTSAVTVGSDGFVLGDVEAIDTGPSTKRLKGESLRFTAAPAGIRESALLVLDVDEGGEEEEPIGSWRARVIQRLRVGLQGGTGSDYEQWILEATPAARTAYVYGNKPTLGTVGFTALKDGTGETRVLTTAEREEVAEYVESKRPITDNLSSLIVTTQAVHIDVRIEVLDSAAFDWDDSAGYTVTTYVPGTRVLTFSPNVPPDLAVGDSLTIKSASPDATGADGFPAIVSAITGANTVVLAPYTGRSEPFSWEPQPGDNIYAFSSTAETVRNAILDGYTVDSVFIPGLNNFGPANPNYAYGDWVSDVTRNMLQAAALIKGAPGVKGVTIVDPALDILADEFEFPDDDTVELLIPGQVIVRSA